MRVGYAKAGFPFGTLVIDPEISCETADARVLDLTPDGIPCIPTLERLHRKTSEPTTKCEHVHRNCVEIVFCQRGELAFESMGRVYPFRPGMVFISRPDEPHRLRTLPRGMLTYAVQFRMGKAGSSVLGLSSGEADCLRERLRLIKDRIFQGGERVRSAFQHVFQTYDEELRGTKWRLFRLRIAILQLLLAVIDASESETMMTGDSLFQEIVSEIRDHPEKAFSIDDLAARTHQAPNNLYRRFRKLTGLPPLAFRNACRIDRAKQLLAKEELSIEKIALELGYSSRQNFATSFRLATDATPSTWRVQHRKGRRVG